VIGVFVGTPMALAQSNDFSSRLNRLENELETLNRAVYNGERPPQNIYTSEVTPSNQTSNRAAAQMEIRLQQIETQMRELTGRIEEQMFTINQLKQDVQTLQAAKINTQTSIDTTSSNVSNNANVSNNNTTALEWKNEDEGMEAATSFVSTGDATALYESAFASLKNKEYKVSRGKFENFLKQYPNHVLSANSKYWLGETYYVEGEYTQAARTFAQGFQEFPDSAKSPDMLLKLGLSLSNTGKKQEACIALSQLPVRFKVGPQDILDRGVDEMDKLGCDTL